MHARRWVDAAFSVAALAALLTTIPHSVTAIGTSFTYQGQLLQNGTPVTGTCDLQFGLFLVPTGGTPIGNAFQVVPNVGIDHGLFTATLDFGAAFDSLGDRFLEVGNRCPGGSGEFTVLLPRQLLTGMPYALGLVLPWVGTIASDQAALSVTNTGVAVVGESLFGAGVRGSSAGSLAGVEGHSTASGGAGVLGQANGSNGIGVKGVATDAAANGTGVLGQVDGSNGIGVRGVANDGDSSKAIYGQSLQGFAGYFDGRVQVISPSSTLPDVFVVSVEFDNVARINADGKGFFNGGTQMGGADVAEFIPVRDGVEPGDVVEIDPERPNHFRRAASANSSAVAGVISTEPGVSLNAKDGAKAEVSGPQLALVGRVPVKVTAENGPIRPGDLLVASSTPGHAMRGPANPAPGTVIGKALTRLEDGVGVTEMLVMLR